MNKLSKRLEIIASYVNDNCKLIDIGCDHAYLDIYLAKNKKNIQIIASDINENALNNAKQNIKEAKLENKIITRLGSGLEVVEKEEIDTIIMSGLGAHKIVGILYNNIDKLDNVNQIIIQSNTNLAFLRKKITSLNYYIENEKLIKENNIIYEVINFKKGKKRYSKRELFFGPLLLRENNSLFREKNKEELDKLNKLMKVIPKRNLHHRYITYLKIRQYRKLT